MAGKIYQKRKSAQMIASEFKKATGKDMTPGFVHWLADRKGFQKHHYGSEIYYASNLRTIVDANYYTLYPIYLRELEQKRAEKETARKSRENSYPHPDLFHDPHCNDDLDESVIRKAIMESINKLLGDS